MFQIWKDLFFIHYSINPSKIKLPLPQNFTLDTINGKALLGIVGFTMKEVYFSPFKYLSYPSFHELNLRTYVTLPNKSPAIYFFSLGVNSYLSACIAKLFYKLPYYYTKISYNTNSKLKSFISQKNRKITNRFLFENEKSNLNREVLPFLLERYSFVTEKNKQFYTGTLNHVPYEFNSIKIIGCQTDLFKNPGFNENDLSIDNSLCCFSKGFKVEVLKFEKYKN